jgi:hypothetical protein
LLFCQKRQNGSKYIRWLGRFSGRVRLARLVRRLCQKLQICWLALRSCCGHIRTQSATEIMSLPLESAHRLPPQWPLGRMTPFARSFYRQMLSEVHPWADIVDLRLFLMGFDAAEQWLLYISGNEVRIRSESSWLTLAEQKFGCHIPSEVEKHIKSPVIPQDSMHDPSDQLPSPESRATSGESGRNCTK